MNDLRRELAPIDKSAWHAMEEEARRVLRLHFAARKVVDFEGPLGLETAAVNLGWSTPLDETPGPGVGARLRRVQPLLELRVPFEVSCEAIDAIARGAERVDLEPLTAAATALAHAENRVVFHGFDAAKIDGLHSHAAHKPISLPADPNGTPHAVTQALEMLRENGVDGPYALLLGPARYTALRETAGPGGYPLLRHVEGLIEGSVVWAPTLIGALMLSRRGGDFRLVVGRDASIGYASHTDLAVRLYFEESFAFRLIDPAAVVPLIEANSAVKRS